LKIFPATKAVRHLSVPRLLRASSEINDFTYSDIVSCGESLFPGSTTLMSVLFSRRRQETDRQTGTARICPVAEAVGVIGPSRR
jgi:hypothetical protein